MNKTLKAIATLSILFFLGSCTENYYNTTNNTYANQESLDTALIGHWVADDTVTNGKINMTFSIDQNFACYYSYTNYDHNPIFSDRMEYYTVSKILHVMETIGTNSPNVYVGDYNISGNTMVTENFENSNLNGSWIKQ